MGKGMRVSLPDALPGRKVLLPAADVVVVAMSAYLALAVRFDELTPIDRLIQWL